MSKIKISILSLALILVSAAGLVAGEPDISAGEFRQMYDSLLAGKTLSNTTEQDGLTVVTERRFGQASDLGEDDQRSMENSQLVVDKRAPIDVKTEKRDYLMKLLERVSEEERTLLIQKEVEGLTIEELAELTGLNENTIKVKLFRARQKLVKASQRLDRTVA